MKPTDPDARAQWIALSLSPHIGAKTVSNLLHHFQADISAVFTASAAELRAVSGIGPKIARDIQNIDPARIARELSDWEGRGIRVLTYADACYPAALKDVPDYPPTLFLRGSWRPQEYQRSIAIVGTRHPSQVAKILTLQLVTKLARSGCAIVSGLALGIDAAAHAAALAAGGTTIAVLGCGVLNIYPPKNRTIASRIVDSGALVSEVHPALAPNAQRLVSRNRIISGLSQAVIMIESAADGGAMHTARFAMEQGRKVYTFRLPASGNGKLMRAGAAVLPSDLERAIPYLLS